MANNKTQIFFDTRFEKAKTFCKTRILYYNVVSYFSYNVILKHVETNYNWF